MPDTKKSRSNSFKEYAGTEFKFCCGDSEQISHMMRKFCGNEDETIECAKMMQMMQKMCCSTSANSEKP